MSCKTITFSIKAPPFSINNAYYKRSMTRTQACRDWGDDILLQLQDSKIQRKLEGFKSGFNPKAEAIEITIWHYMPTEIMYTKKGEVSRRSKDLSNVEKLPIDLIFDSRFENRIIDDTIIKNLCLDDKFIMDLNSRKRAAREYRIDVTLERVPNLYDQAPK